MLNKWFDDYIKDLDITKIDWICLDRLEFEKFMLDNYYDKYNKSYVTDRLINSTYVIPLGMKYLYYSKTNNDYKYILGVSDNKIGKKTILTCITYIDNIYLFKEQKTPITYITSAEVNYYFRNKGLFKKSSEKLIEFIPLDQNIIVSRQSELGMKCNVYSTIKNDLLRNNFEQNILYDDNNDEKIKEIICSKTRILKKEK